MGAIQDVKNAGGRVKVVSDTSKNQNQERVRAEARPRWGVMVTVFGSDGYGEGDTKEAAAAAAIRNLPAQYHRHFPGVGRDVTRRDPKGETRPFAFANRTQASKKAEQLGPGWEVIGSYPYWESRCSTSPAAGHGSPHTTKVADHEDHPSGRW